MLLLAQDPWSHAEVRKLIALIATEHLRTQAAFDALPVAVGVLAPDLRVIWANQPLKALLPAIQSAESGVREAVERVSRTGATTDTTIGGTDVRLHICANRALPGEIVVVAGEHCPGGADTAVNTLSALEHAEVPIFVYTREGRMIFVNSHATELTGYAREALLRLRLAELSPEHHRQMLSPGDCTVTIRNLTGPGVPLKCRVKSTAIDADEVFCLTVIGKEHEISGYASNLSAIEGCLTGAFPDSTISKVPAADPHRHRFRVITETHERVLTVTDGALRSPQFRAHLREVPEALNLTRSVMLTEEGVRVE
jgi:hypothetical protein